MCISHCDSNLDKAVTTASACAGIGGGHADPFSLSFFRDGKERRGDAVLQTTKCCGGGSVLVHPVQWHIVCAQQDVLKEAHPGILDRDL